MFHSNLQISRNSVYLPMFVNICECGGCVEIGFPGVRFLRARGDNGGDTNGLLRFNCNNSSQQMHPHSREFSLCRRNFGRYHQFGEKKFIKILRKSAGDIYQAIKTLWNKKHTLAPNAKGGCGVEQGKTDQQRDGWARRLATEMPKSAPNLALPKMG